MLRIDRALAFKDDLYFRFPTSGCAGRAHLVWVAFVPFHGAFAAGLLLGWTEDPVIRTLRAVHSFVGPPKRDSYAALKTPAAPLRKKLLKDRNLAAMPAELPVTCHLGEDTISGYAERGNRRPAVSAEPIFDGVSSVISGPAIEADGLCVLACAEFASAMVTEHLSPLIVGGA